MLSFYVSEKEWMQSSSQNETTPVGQCFGYGLTEIAGGREGEAGIALGKP